MFGTHFKKGYLLNSFWICVWVHFLSNIFWILFLNTSWHYEFFEDYFWMFFSNTFLDVFSKSLCLNIFFGILYFLGAIYFLEYVHILNMFILCFCICFGYIFGIYFLVTVFCLCFESLLFFCWTMFIWQCFLTMFLKRRFVIYLFLNIFAEYRFWICIYIYISFFDYGVWIYTWSTYMYVYPYLRHLHISPYHSP